MLCGNRPLGPPGSRSSAVVDDSHLPYDEQRAQQPPPPPPPYPKLSKAQRQAAARTAAAKSKNKLWGPSHSFDSDDDDDDDLSLNSNNNADNDSNNNKYASNLGVQGGFGCVPTTSSNTSNAPPGSMQSWLETMGKAWTEVHATAMKHVVRPSTASHARTSSSKSGRKKRNGLLTSHQLMEVVPEEDGQESDTDPSTQEDDSNNHQQAPQNNPVTSRKGSHPSSRNEVNTSRGDGSKPATDRRSASNTTLQDGDVPFDATTPPSKMEDWTDLIFSCGAASPCSAQDLEDLFGQQERSCKTNSNTNTCGLGIAPLKFDCGGDDDGVVATTPSEQRQRSQPQQQAAPSAPQAPQRTWSSDSTPAERRRQRNQVRRSRHEQAIKTSLSQQEQFSMAPHEDFEVTSQQDVLVTQPTTTALLQQQSQFPPPLADSDIPKDTVLHFPPLNQHPQTILQQQQSQHSQPQIPVPMETLLVKEEEAQALERSISELTMRSSYQPPPTTSTAHAPPEQRRMAYYAVGRHHRLSANNAGPRSGGNRRCYFTGKLIFGGAPFYAGIVQQGLRTLVVFCLPSALGMPQNLPGYNAKDHHKRGGSVAGSGGGGLLQRSRRTLSSAASISTKKSLLSKSTYGSRGAHSKLSSTIHLDDMSLSIEGDIDPNWNLDKDYLLRVLPEPAEDDAVLTEMNQRFPEQFETLPVQVRHPKCWRIYVKFCFFSGLPIAEGELHYQVLPKLALELYGEDIVLSHDVMEAVNGASSADILKLPNQKTFRYLKKHYQQQSAKLPEIVFKRTSWEQVKPEV